MKQFLRRAALVAALVGAASALGCGGTLNGNSNYQMGVPYRQQEQFNYCVPASILMWRLYDGLSSLSQSYIFNEIGGAPCDPFDAAYGVSRFTISGSDAYLDLTYGPSEDERDEMVARQVTSINTAVPVMPIVGASKNHVGIINGGKYSDEGTYYEWEYLYFHDPDPAYGSNIYYAGGDWLFEFCMPFDSYCGQIVSSSATFDWQNNNSTYGDSVAVYGGGGGCMPSKCGPPAY